MAVHALNTPTPPRHRRRPWHQYRPEIEALIERLVDILDEVDGDPDREPDLGWLGAGSALSIVGGNDDDREQDVGDEGEPHEDDEPRLGWPSNVGLGAVTLSTNPRFQFAMMDQEYEPNLAPLRGGQGA